MIAALLLAAAALCPAPHRSQSVVDAFRRATPCPTSCATYSVTVLPDRIEVVLYEKCGACQVNHHCALACGGADDAANMEWLSVAENLRRGADCSFCAQPFTVCGVRR